MLSEGTHLVNPFKVNNTMTARTQEVKESASVPSNEGLIISMDTSLLFRIDPAKAPEVYRTVGPNYLDVVVEPNLRSAIRESTASHSATEKHTKTMAYCISVKAMHRCASACTPVTMRGSCDI